MRLDVLERTIQAGMPCRLCPQILKDVFRVYSYRREFDQVIVNLSDGRSEVLRIPSNRIITLH